MIGVASPSKPFTFTPKGTTQRQKILAAYEKEIDALYAAVDESTHTDIDAPEDWSIPQTKVFVRTVIEKIMKTRTHVSDTDDLFERGLDRFVIYILVFSLTLTNGCEVCRQHGYVTRSWVFFERETQQLQENFLRHSYTTTPLSNSYHHSYPP